MMRYLVGILAVITALMVQPAQAQHTLNIRDADIRAFVADAAKVTGRTFILDSRVQGKVSVVTDRPLSRSEYFEVFLSTLRANGLVAVPTGRGYRIQPADGAATQPSQVGSKGAATNQFITEIVRLKSIVASEALETLRPLVSKQGSITANRNSNALVVVDYADNIHRIRQLVREIDQDNAASTIVNLQNAGAREIADSLQSLATQGGSESARAPVTIVPIDSSNSIALRGDPGAVSKFASMARELDNRAELGTEIRVHRLDYANAEALLPVIEQILGQGSGAARATMEPAGRNGGEAPAPQPVNASFTEGGNSGSGIARRGPAIVTRLDGTNALIVAANPDVQRMVGELIRQLDTRQEQVVVEAIVVEISENLANQLGVQWLMGGKDEPFAVTNFSNSSPNIVDVAGGLLADQFNSSTTTTTDTATTTTSNSAVGDSLTQNAADAILSARGGFAGFATSLGGHAALGAIINAVREDTQSNVLSTPSLTVNNNLKGSILFGQEIPVSTGEALSDNFDNAFRTIQRQNVGIELEVTPQINAGSEVRMELKQQVSSIAGPVSDDFGELIINKREINTTVTVGDGEIIALGGLLDDNERKTIHQIPLLGDIPLIGELFKSRSKSRVKTNLMVFIRPTILRNPNDARRFSDRRYNYIRARQMIQNPDQEPSLDTLVRDYLGTVPPSTKPRPDDQIISAPDIRQNNQTAPDVIGATPKSLNDIEGQ